ncbi:ICMT-domain-containing protein [Jaminaea rosea]|uniref:Protein-S-isoprenylcysteine O-methyltransferase n=1 Tax=Jaminaea rosea TaxID=1569628 RepID=A0A316UZ95_9BASI|nr:ICMT-domain-containing protein [Jaminaea rosea]PWN28485.1 ICMT-domain-containing protein [Jaminaea rosea]
MASIPEGTKASIRQRVTGKDEDEMPLNGNGNANLPAPAAYNSFWYNQESIPAHFAPLSLRLVLIGWSLGLLAGISLTLASPLLLPWATTASSNLNDWSWWHVLIAPQLHLYLAAWATFHLLEFVVTARWNPTRLMQDSFLLQNGWNYHAAHLGGIVEFLLEASFFPNIKLASRSSSPAYLALSLYSGLLLLLLGQLLRSHSMISAAGNFSHQVAHKKRDDHVLVKSGVYAWVRHPSYTGFFTWAAATQLVLCNPVGVVVFLGVLWHFFSQRIKSEEASLVAFFGKDYEEYRRKVPSGIPFVR